MVDVRDPQPGDAEALAANLRDQDVAELIAAGHTDFVATINDAIGRSTYAWTAVDGDEIVAVFGVAPFGTLLDPRGVPWMLGTPLVKTHRRVLARLAAPYIHTMTRVYPHLLNCVHARNTVATGWLRRVGFTLGEPFPHPETGEPFHLFELKRHV